MKYIFATVLLALASLQCSAGRSGTNAAESSGARPDTWIADRHIVALGVASDVRNNLPTDQLNNPVAQEIKRLTGISMEVMGASGGSSTEILAASAAAGNLEELFMYYLNHSARPEFPILYKAANEGVLTDISEYIKDSKHLSRYYESGFLPVDTQRNIMFREEWNGAVYLFHSNIDEVPFEGTFTRDDYFGGLYIREDIAQALGIDVKTINTLGDFYNLLRTIQNGNFTDKNGRPVVPLGPSHWGGYRTWFMDPLEYGREFGGWHYENDNFQFIMDTEYPERQLEFVQKLLNEGLIHKEYFTMDAQRANELALSGGSAVIGDSHNFSDFNASEKYLPIVLNDFTGTKNKWGASKTGYGGWAIPSYVERPGEIVAFIDFLVGPDGQALWKYGIEGQHYDVRDGGFFVKPELLAAVTGDRQFLRDLNIYASASGSRWASFLGNTIVNDVQNFGEYSYGNLARGEAESRAEYLFENYYKDMSVGNFYDGLMVSSFLNDNEQFDELRDLLNNYKNLMIEAFFQPTFDAGIAVLNNYRRLLGDAGMEEFKGYLQKVNREQPGLIAITTAKY